MKISEAIEKIKAYHKGKINGKTIDVQTTRDKILFGNPDQECSGIITTCWASSDVILEAISRKANLIIVHEALFWNHGDHTDWLKKNETYRSKAELLKKYGIVVWRNHDYIHSGIPMADGSYTDGIFYGLAKKLGWQEYIKKNREMPMYFEIEETTAGELAHFLVNTLRLNGIKIIGNTYTVIRRVRIPFHVLGDARDEITEAQKEKIDCFLTMELVDFTLAEYIYDSSALGFNKCIIAMGHFNLEEPGMEYMLAYLKKALGAEIPCSFVQAGDMYSYITK